jgi:hypothetical protein
MDFQLGADVVWGVWCTCMDTLCSVRCNYAVPLGVSRDTKDIA